MNQIWVETEGDLRRFFRRIIAEALLYPTLVTGAAIAGAIVLSRTYPDTARPIVLLRDLGWVAPVSVLLALHGLEKLRQFHTHQGWYRAFALIAHKLQENCGIVHALEYASHESPEPFRTLLRESALECSGGTGPVAPLQHRGCPPELRLCVTESRNEKDLGERLGELFRTRREEIRGKIAPAERFAPALGVLAAGAVVLWMVIRLVLPVLETLYTGGWHG